MGGERRREKRGEGSVDNREEEMGVEEKKGEGKKGEENKGERRRRPCP